MMAREGLSATALANFSGVRRWRLLEEILRTNPDVLAVQEIDHFHDFFAPALTQRLPGTPIIPSAEDRDLVGRVIFEELVEGVVKDSSRDDLTAMIARYAEEGADGVILGCTELCMILSEGDGPLPVFSTTHIHADAVNDWMTGKARA